MIAATTLSCVSVRETNLKRFKEITKDIPINNERDVILVQHLYNEIVNVKK